MKNYCLGCTIKIITKMGHEKKELKTAGLDFFFLFT